MTSIFEFSSSVLVIVAGLAITHLLGGLGSIIRYRKYLRIDWLPIVWMLVLMLTLIGWFYAIWDMLHEVESLDYSTLLVFFSTSVLFYLAARLITPDIAPKTQLDLSQAFFETKTAFFASASGAYLVLTLYVWSEQGFIKTVGGIEGALGLSLMLLMACGMVLRNSTSHWLLVSLWSAIYLIQQTGQGAMAG
jgi:hypothetical protein